jgi:hypothetical protein
MRTYNMDRIWNAVKRTVFGKLVQRECDLPLAHDFTRGALWAPSMVEAMGKMFLKEQPIPALKGGLYGYESRRWLSPDIAGVMDFSGTGSEGQFYVLDYFLVEVIGFTFGVAGTTTACKIDFDLYPGINATGTIIASNLDGTNGTVTAANNTTALAIGAVNYKNIGDLTGPVLCKPGNSIDIDVATACTLGTSAMAFVIGTPGTETQWLNLTAGFPITT